MEVPEHIIYLYLKHLRGELNAGEQEELLLWEEAFPEAAVTAQQNLSPGKLEMLLQEITKAETRAMERYREAGILSGKPVRHMHPFIRWGRIAAISILAAGIGFYIFWVNNHQQTATSLSDNRTEVVPSRILAGKEGAILTLADGSQILLDSLTDGVIASQDGAAVVLQNNSLAYNTIQNENDTALVYNTMRTPKGRQYRLTLPDGTKVWLNAATSLRFPTRFAGKERLVEVNGEAWFEVAKNTKMPFRVNIGDHAALEVLGTAFNINAYENEDNIQTTLVEGSVRVIKGTENITLKAGQQARITAQTITSQKSITLLENVNIEKVMAWRNGAFNFEGLTLKEAMRQLERWYDITIEVKNAASKRVLGGEMARNLSLDKALDVLTEVGIQYEWRDSTLVIH